MSLDISSVIFVGYVNSKITRINVRTATLFYTEGLHADLFERLGLKTTFAVTR